MKNFQEHPQSMLITDSIWPVLQERHSDGQYAIGQDSGIHWRSVDPDEEFEKGAVISSWFYVPNVPPLLDGQVRRLYMYWHEHLAPFVVMEFASDDGSEERDKTPIFGKFWIYEQVIRPPFYIIYEVWTGQVELYELVERQYQLVPPNERGHYPISPLGIEIGIWDGIYQNQHLPWLRLWDREGNLLLTAEERLAQEHKRVERLMAQLRALGVEPEGI